MGDERDSPLDHDDEEIAAEAAGDAESLFSLLPQYYRGEISQANAARVRMDQSTTWAITFIAALVSVVFSGAGVPAYLLLIGIAALSIFLTYDVRRYRDFDLYRARVRFVQENVFANALEPTGVEHPNWREELSDDLRHPTFKVTTLEALSRRIRRIYGLLFAFLALAWIAKITVFSPETAWTEAAALPGFPGPLVALSLGIFYAVLFVLSMSSGTREAKGEVYGEEPGEWKQK